MSSIEINGQQIPWSAIGRIRKLCGGDWDTTIDAFWKARGADGQNGVLRYVQRGFVPDKAGKRYSLMPSKERENGEMEKVREWWKGLYTPSTKRETMSMAQVMRNIMGAA
jgi:hypothetical protein